MFDFEIGPEDITRVGVRVMVPHENCSRSYNVELTWRTLYEIAYMKPTVVKGAATQRLQNGAMRIGFTCPACVKTYSFSERDRAAMTTVVHDITPNEALELIAAGNTRGFNTRALAGAGA